MSTRPRIALHPLAALLLVLPNATPAGGQSTLSAETMARITALEPRVVAWRRDIHQHPELGNREVRTSKLVADHLRALGIEVQTGVAHTGVVGLLRGSRPGPVVLLRADMDALPVTERVKLPFASKVRTTYGGVETGVMHACGHDSHVAILMGVADVLAGMKNQLAGTVKFVFQPAEEGPPEGEEGGAKLMVKQGVLESPKVDAAFALHIDAKTEVNTIGYTPRGTFASADDFRIIVKGKQTHGGYPWNGVDPIVVSAHIVTALQSIVSRQMNLVDNPSVVTVGKIQGGVRSNIIPEQVEMMGTIRALDPEDRKRLHESIRRIATNVAEGMNATADVKIGVTTDYPVTFNDEKLTAAMVPVLESVAGPGRARLMKPETGAEDFAYIAERVPSVYIYIGGRPANVAPADAADHHTPDFYIDESGFGLGVRALTAMTLHYMRSRPVTP